MNAEELAERIASFFGLKAHGDQVILESGSLVMTFNGWRIILVSKVKKMELRENCLYLKNGDQTLKVVLQNFFVVPYLTPTKSYLKVIPYDKLLSLFPVISGKVENDEVGYAMLEALSNGESYEGYIDGGIYDFSKGLLEVNAPGLGYTFTFTPSVATVKGFGLNKEFNVEDYRVSLRAYRHVVYISLKRE